MKTLRLCFIFAAALAVISAGAQAQLVGKTATYAELGASCGQAGQVAIVTDADAPNSVGDGSGAYKIVASCVSGTWTALALDTARILTPLKVTNVTVADDGAGTKPTGAIPITTDVATCTCNDATGCTMSIAEPTVVSGYGGYLFVISIGSGNCEIADSSGVVELGTTLVLEPTSTASFVYGGSAWYNVATKDNVP